MKIAHITDLHLDEEFPVQNGVPTRSNWEAVFESISKSNIDRMILGGDLGENDSLPYLFDTLKMGNFDLNITPGNHDESEVIAQFYPHSMLSASNGICQQTEDEYFKYIFMDSSKSAINEVQFEWFQKAIKTQKQLMLFIHHPVLEVDTAVDKSYPLEGRDRIAELLFAHNENVYVFCGHYHMVDDKRIQNVHQFISPAASFQVEKNPYKVVTDFNTFGYRIINIEEASVSSDIILL